MNGHIDQIDSVVHFETRQMLDTWDKQIQSLCFQVEKEKSWWISFILFLGEFCDWQDNYQGAWLAEQDNGGSDGVLNDLEIVSNYDKNSAVETGETFNIISD